MDTFCSKSQSSRRLFAAEDDCKVMSMTRSNVFIITWAKRQLTFDAYWAFFSLFLLVRQGCFVEKSTCNKCHSKCQRQSISTNTMAHTLGPVVNINWELPLTLGLIFFDSLLVEGEKTSEKFVDRNFFQPIKFQVFTHFFDL